MYQLFQSSNPKEDNLSDSEQYENYTSYSPDFSTESSFHNPILDLPESDQPTYEEFVYDESLTNISANSNDIGEEQVSEEEDDNDDESTDEDDLIDEKYEISSFTDRFLVIVVTTGKILYYNFLYFIHFLKENLNFQRLKND